MAYPKHIPTSLVVRSVASAGTKISDLLPFQLGIFDEDTHVALSAADVQRRRTVYLGVGSPNVKQFTQGSKVERNSNQNNGDIDFRSEPITTSAVNLIRAQQPKRGDKPNVYYLGWNGIDDCKSLSFSCGKTYKFNVEVKGKPVRDIFMQDFRQLIELTTDSCDNCATTACTDGVGCEKYIDQLVTNFNDPNYFVSRFFTAEKTINCSPALPSLTKTTFNKYQLVVPDNGDAIDLATIQNLYPTLKVEVWDRKAPYTTYVITKTGTAPSAYTANETVLSNCTTCPSGFTTVASGYASVVEIDNANPAAVLSTVQAVWATVTSARLLSFAGGTSTYYVVSPAPLANPAAGVDARVVSNLGSVLGRCDKTTPSSYGWTLMGTTYKVQRTLCITLPYDDCDTDKDGADAGELLARLTSMYGTNPDVVTGTLTYSADSTSCLARYTLAQYNNDFLVDGCDTYALAAFNVLPAFEGQLWQVCDCDGWTVNAAGCPIPPTPTDRCCQCGIKFTTRSTVDILDRFAGYDIAEYLAKEPVTLHISLWRDDNELNVTDFPSVSWIQTGQAQFRQLRGDDVIKRIIQEQFYNKMPWVNQIDKENQLFLQREGIKLGVNVDDYYFAFDIYHNVTNTGNNTASNNNLGECITLFISEKDLATVDSVEQLLGTAFPMAKLENFV